MKEPFGIPPASRKLPQDVIARQANTIAASPAAMVFNNLPDSVVVFNTARQIVYCNERFRALLPDKGENHSVLGQRLGEALSCLGLNIESGGCGMSELCRHCGARESLAALDAGISAEADGECRLNLCDGNALSSLDFRLHVWAMPQDGEVFHAAVLADTRAEKRLALMERVFYHDALNLVSGMRGLCELLRQTPDCPQQSELDLLVFAVERLSELINAQREFNQAERGEYEVISSKLHVRPLLEYIAALMRQESTGRGKIVALDSHCCEISLVSDRKLVTRILINMFKNALEATPPGGTVTAGCDTEPDHIRFWVHNPGTLPQETKEQIFRRTFSTKGKGRGLGTYSMKLFAENYLDGQVGFTTDPESGTEFFVRLPYVLRCNDAA